MFHEPGNNELHDRPQFVEVLKTQPTVGGASYWADAALIAAAGIPTVIFGPGGAGAHSVEEWVDVADTVAVARVLTRVAERLSS